MNKPKQPAAGTPTGLQGPAPAAYVPSREDQALAATYEAQVPPTRPAQSAGVVRPHPAPPEYVDPYLFEVGFYASRAEYDELMRTSDIRPRAEVENAPPRRKPRARKA